MISNRQSLDEAVQQYHKMCRLLGVKIRSMLGGNHLALTNYVDLRDQRNRRIAACVKRDGRWWIKFPSPDDK